MPSHGLALTLTAVAYTVCHHVGSLPDGLGPAAEGTRVGDWIDLLVPYLVLLPGLLTLLAARVSTATYVWFAVGSWLYAQGHGIHLAANSIGNAEAGETAHLWDEYVGHWVWYAGLVVVAATLATTMVDRPRPRNPLVWVLAVGCGLTWATNAVGGQLTVGGVAVAAVASAWGLRHRDDQGALVGAAGIPATVLLVLAWTFGWDFD